MELTALEFGGNMARKIRSDSTIKSLTKKFGIPEEYFRDEKGRKIRNDATLGTLRKRAAKGK